MLFAHPAFLTGLARTLDIGATLSRHSYNEAASPAAADAAAMASDWATVGDGIRHAIEIVTRGGEEE